MHRVLYLAPGRTQTTRPTLSLLYPRLNSKTVSPPPATPTLPDTYPFHYLASNGPANNWSTANITHSGSEDRTALVQFNQPATITPRTGTVVGGGSGAGAGCTEIAWSDSTH